MRDAKDVALVHLVFKPRGSLRRGRGCDGTVNGVLLARETVAEQTIHLSLATGAEMTACRSDSVSAECCHDFGRSVWSSLASALVLLGRQRWDSRRRWEIRATAPRHNEQHERKPDPSHLLPLPARCVPESSRQGWGRAERSSDP